MCNNLPGNRYKFHSHIPLRGSVRSYVNNNARRSVIKSNSYIFYTKFTKNSCPYTSNFIYTFPVDLSQWCYYVTQYTRLTNAKRIAKLYIIRFINGELLYPPYTEIL